MDMSSQTPAYDAFGDVAVGGRGRESGTRRARKLAVAVFWSIALLLIAGRVCQTGLNGGPPSGTIEMASR